MIKDDWEDGEDIYAEAMNAIADAVNGAPAAAAAASKSADTITDGTTNKAFLATERTKLTGIATGATANDTDANLKARANHTGTQTSSTISDFTEAVQDAVAALLAQGTNVTLTYNDAANTLTVAASGGSGGLDAEAVRDAIGVALLGTGLIAVTVNDAADTITVSTTATANDTDANLKARANHTGTQSADTLTDGTTNKAFLATERTKLTGIATAATANDTDANLKARANHTGTQSADTLTDGTTNKAFLATERTKLTGIATAATANDTDANLKARANHTGTQAASTISDFTEAVQDTVGAFVSGSSGVSVTYNDTANTLVVAGSASANVLYRFEAGANTRKLITSTANAVAGTGISDHLIIGDSMSSAYTGAAFDYPNAWYRQLKARLVAAGIPDAGTGVVATNEGNSSYDPRWTWTGTWDRTSNVYAAGSGTCSAIFTSDLPGTAIDLFYSHAGGSFKVSVDGGSAVDVIAAGTLTLGTYTVTGLANVPHVITVTTTGACIITGAQCRQAAGVRFSSLGKYGLTAQGFLGDGGFIKSIATAVVPTPDVLHLPIGANDMTANARTQAQLIADITTLRGLWSSADVILYAQPLTETNEISDATWNGYTAALRALADTLGCPLIDFNQRYGGSTAVNAMGYVGTDGKHPNAVAQADMAATVFAGLTRVGILPTRPRVTPRTSAVSNTTSWTVNADSTDHAVNTGLTGAVTINNPTGIPLPGQRLWLALTGTASRAITHGTAFEASGAVALPTTTSGTARLDVGYVWNATTSKWRCVAVA